MDANRHVPAVEKAIRILEYYKQSSSPYAGITEISNALNISKSTVHGILQTLMDYKYISKSRISGDYALGPAVTDLSGAFENYDVILEKVKKEISEKRSFLLETVSVTVLEREMVRVLYSVPPRDHMVAVNFMPDQILSPIILTAGMVHLSRFDDESVERIYNIHAKAVPVRLRYSWEDFIRGVRFTRRNGYCFNENDLHEDVVSISFPVYNDSGNLTVAITMSIPKNRYYERDKEGYIEAMRRLVSSVHLM